jgi:nucleoside-diphosphate-sugar epimerase
MERQAGIAMKVLVAGSRGYCGVGIVQAFKQHGCQVIGLDLSEPTSVEADSSVQEIRADLLDFETLLAAMEGCQAVIDAALYRPGNIPEDRLPKLLLPGNDTPFDFTSVQTFQVNVTGTLYLLEAARQLRLQQVVLLSSARVIWDHFVGRNGETLSPGFQANAETPLNFSDAYGLSKYLQEQLGQFYADEYGISITLFRPWWVVDGATDTNRMNIPLAKDTIPLSPAGMVDRNDLGEACYLALQHPEISCEIFYPVSGPDCERYFDIQPLIRRLGWQPVYSFDHLARNP